MISVLHFDSGSDGFVERARTALSALAERPGYLRGTLGRSTDDERAWVIVTEWADVGSYRRALSNVAVKLHAAPLLAEALDLPSGFESLAELASDGTMALRASDRAPGPA
ncbi:MAG: antibiotic biosynthesis monooxygenase family protein [Jatrophihabitantaceae bacterium]